MKTKQLLTAFLLIVLSAWFLSFFQANESAGAVSTSVAPPVEWTNTYGGAGGQSASSICQTTDGGYALFGESGIDGLIVKVDSNGVLQWTKTFSKAGYERRITVGQQTTDGGYILAGGLDISGAGTGNTFMIKTDGVGNVQWEKTYGGSGTDTSATFSAQQTNDGGYVLAGAGANNFALLIKTDSSGNAIWSKTYGATTIARSVQQASDGGYIIAGEISTTDGFTDGWYAKTDVNGNIAWSKTQGGLNKQDWVNYVRTTADGGYIMTGCFGRDPYAQFHFSTGEFGIVKTDSAGNVQWSRQFTDIGIFPQSTTAEGNSVQQTTDGGFIAIGHFGPYESWLVKVDSNRKLLWTKTYTTYGDGKSYAIQTSSRDYLVAYQTQGPTQNDGSDIKLTKIMRANPPVATYSYEPSNPLVQQTIVFNASTSHDLDNDISSYKWDFKNDNITTTSNPAVSHTYSTAGVYNVTLTVTDCEELRSLFAQEISVKVYTSLSFSASSETMYANSPVTFSGILSDSQGRGIGNVPVSIYYAPSGSSQWNLIAEDLSGSLGNYEITWNPSIIGKVSIKAEWIGNQTYYGSNNVTNIEVLSNPATLLIHLGCSSSNVGLKVGISGSLTSNGIGFSGIPVLLSYSVTGGQTWNEISQVTTAYDGAYSAIWMPSATGEYIVKAVWAGNVTVQGAISLADLAVVPFDSKNVFSVVSNSTISALSFNSDSRELHFTVNGASGTYGFIDIFIAKTLIPNVDAVKIYLNGNPTQYTSSAVEDSYLLHFTYSQSSHTIAVMFGFSGLPLGISIETFALIGMLAGVICSGVGYYVWRKKRSRYHTSTNPFKRFKIVQ